MAKYKRPQSQRGALGAVVPEEIDRSILVIRGQKVLSDSQLAAFYGVETRVLIQAVNPNTERFPDDFMFQLTAHEWAALRSQIVIFIAGVLRSWLVVLAADRFDRLTRSFLSALPHGA